MIAAATPEHLPGVLHSLEPTLDRFGYLAVVGLVLIEDFGAPVPGETVLLNIVLVGLLGFCGAVISDNIGFAIGHFGGRPLIRRYGKYIFLTDERIDRATGFFERHGGWIIIVARFIEGLLLSNAIGAALWVGVWTCIGYFSGNHINAIYDAASRYSVYLAIAFGLVVLALIARHVVRVRRARTPDAS